MGNCCDEQCSAVQLLRACALYDCADEPCVCSRSQTNCSYKILAHASVYLALAAWQVTYRRLRETLEALGSAQSASGSSSTLVDVLFGRAMPRFADNPPQWTPRNACLDASQQRAVSRALAGKDITLIHGPPGTGKTTAVVEVVQQEAQRGNKV